MDDSQGRVEILALINWFRGIILISIGLVIFYFMLGIRKEEWIGGIFAMIFNLIALIIFGIGIVSLIIGYGLHTNKRWVLILLRAFRLIVLFIFLFLILMLISQHEQLRVVAIILFILVAVDVVSLWYLYPKFEVEDVNTKDEDDEDDED